MPSEIIRGSLYIGNCQDGRTAHEHPVDYDRVIALASSDHDNVTDADTFEIPDGGWGFDRDEDYSTFKDAVNALRDALDNEETVLIHCNVGRSRAPAVAIAALATIHDLSYEETLARVQDKRNIVNPTPELRYCAKYYIDTYGVHFG